MSLLPPQHRKRGSGFTVTELLVVAALIACLVVLAAPAYQAVRRASLRAANLQNIRDVSRGLLGWIQEVNQGRFPYAYIDRTASKYPAGFDVAGLPAHYSYWAGAVYHSGHVGKIETFFSPLQEKPYWKDPAFQSRMRNDATAWQWAMIGYGVNGVLMPYATDARGMPTRKLATLDGGASVILLAEASPNPSQSSNGKYDGFHAVRPKKMTYPLAVRTPGAVAVCFVDGHAAQLSPKELGWEEATEKWSATANDTAPPWDAPKP